MVHSIAKSLGLDKGLVKAWNFIFVVAHNPSLVLIIPFFG